MLDRHADVAVGVPGEGVAKLGGLMTSLLVEAGPNLCLPGPSKCANQ